MASAFRLDKNNRRLRERLFLRHFLCYYLVMKKYLGFIILIVVVLVGVVLWVDNKKQTPEIPPVNVTNTSSQPAVSNSNNVAALYTPTPYQEIKSPVIVSGKANFFEAVVSIRIKDDAGKVLAETTTMASGAYDKLYPFSKSVVYLKPSTSKGTVEIYEASAKDGSDTNKISIPIVFKD
ncbi:MAG: Spore germination protein-like protein [Candidatus Doudnabacteria bacterium]|nr:Spore germination protein-like protein [Candidatus Doudnabacteria bacterium]